MLGKNNTLHVSKVVVTKSTDQDALQGWIRIPEEIREGVANGSFARIRVDTEVVVCQVRGANHKGRVAAINEHYRQALRIEAGQRSGLGDKTRRVDIWQAKSVINAPGPLGAVGLGFQSGWVHSGHGGSSYCAVTLRHRVNGQCLGMGRLGVHYFGWSDGVPSRVLV